MKKRSVSSKVILLFVVLVCCVCGAIFFLKSMSKPVGIHVDGSKYQYSKILTDDIVIEYSGVLPDCKLSDYKGVVVMDSSSYISDTVGLYLGDEHFSCPVDLIYYKGIEWNWQMSDTDIMNYVNPPDAYDEDGLADEDALKYQDGLKPEFFTGTITYTDGEVGKVQPDSVICREDSQGINLYFTFYGKEYSKSIKFDRTGYSGLTLEEKVEKGDLTVSDEARSILDSKYSDYFPIMKDNSFDSEGNLNLRKYTRDIGKDTRFSRETWLAENGQALVDYLNSIDENWWTDMSVLEGYLVIAGSEDFKSFLWHHVWAFEGYSGDYEYLRPDYIAENNPDLDLYTLLYVYGLPEDLYKDGVSFNVGKLLEGAETRQDIKDRIREFRDTQDIDSIIIYTNNSSSESSELNESIEP